MVLYGTVFFPNECNLDARLLISTIFKYAIIPYTEYCLKNPKNKLNKNNEQRNLVKLLQTLLEISLNESRGNINLSNIIYPCYETSGTFKKPSIKKLLTELLTYYRDTYLKKQSHFFNDCLLSMLRDFELSPFLVPIKDCYVIY